MTADAIGEADCGAEGRSGLAAAEAQAEIAAAHKIRPENSLTETRL